MNIYVYLYGYFECSLSLSMYIHLMLVAMLPKTILAYMCVSEEFWLLANELKFMISIPYSNGRMSSNISHLIYTVKSKEYGV